MITSEKLKIYQKYFGNTEGWDRFGKPEDKEVLEYYEWNLIDKLIHRLELVEKGLASDSFNSQTLKDLKKVCDSEKTEQELKRLARKYS